MTHRNRNGAKSKFKVGDYVLLTGKEGYIRYIGERLHNHGKWYGIELVIGNGHMSGSEHGKRYFLCKYNKGIFIRSSAIKAKLSDLPNNNNNRTKNTTHRKHRLSSRNTLKSPKSKHKMSRSISPLSRTQKNKTKSRAKSRAKPRIYTHNTNTNPTGEPSYKRSKSNANISSHKRKSKNKCANKSKFIGADGKLSTGNVYSNSQRINRMKLKNSKSTDHQISRSKLKPLKLKHNKSHSINMSKKNKKYTKKRVDSNIKPSVVLKHKKRLSNTQKNKYISKPLPKLKPSSSGHVISKSVGARGAEYNNKNNMFDLEAILCNENSKTNTNKKANVKKIKKKKKKRNKSKSKLKNKSKSKDTKPIMKFKERSDQFNLRKSRRNRSISPAKKYRVRELTTDLNQIDNKKYGKRRSRSTNSLFSTRKRHGWDIDIVNGNVNEYEWKCEKCHRMNEYEWKCEKCHRMNECDFKFCPNCGEKRPLHAMKKVEISLVMEELKQGSDSDEMAESDEEMESEYENSNELYKYIEDEQKQMESILYEMKFEENKKLEKMQAEKDELNELKKEDFIKTLDNINTNINGCPKDKPPVVSVNVSPKEKVKKLKAIKNWILSPRTILSPKVKYETKYENTNEYVLQNEESISMSDISYAYGIDSHRGENDKLINIKLTDSYKHSLDLIPDTPRSTIDEYNQTPIETNNDNTFNGYVANIENNMNVMNKNNSKQNGYIKKKHRKKKPKNVRKKKKSKKKKTLEKRYELSSDENI